MTDAEADAWLVAGAIAAMVSDRISKFMKITAIEFEHGDGRRQVITFASGAKVRIGVESVDA
jgi:hypothetical protein